MAQVIVHADLALVRRIIAGDQAEFRALFDRFFPRLYRFVLARVKGDNDVADEIVQRTFCKAIERLDGYRGEAALYTWFCQICRNTLFDYWRARNRDVATVTLLEDHPELRGLLESLEAPALEQPEEILAQQDLRRLVQTTVDTLPEHYGQVLEWKYVDELSVAEIATRLAVGLKAAESLLSRARAAFREAMVAVAAAPDIVRGVSGP